MNVCPNLGQISNQEAGGMEPQNLVDGLKEQIERNKELKKMYNEISQGVFGAKMITLDIEEAEQALINNDVVAMTRSYKVLEANQ